VQGRAGPTSPSLAVPPPEGPAGRHQHRARGAARAPGVRSGHACHSLRGPHARRASVRVNVADTTCGEEGEGGGRRGPPRCGPYHTVGCPTVARLRPPLGWKTLLPACGWPTGPPIGTGTARARSRVPDPLRSPLELGEGGRGRGHRILPLRPRPRLRACIGEPHGRAARLSSTKPVDSRGRAARARPRGRGTEVYPRRPPGLARHLPRARSCRSRACKTMLRGERGHRLFRPDRRGEKEGSSCRWGCGEGCQCQSEAQSGVCGRPPSRAPCVVEDVRTGEHTDMARAADCGHTLAWSKAASVPPLVHSHTSPAQLASAPVQGLWPDTSSEGLHVGSEVLHPKGRTESRHCQAAHSVILAAAGRASPPSSLLPPPHRWYPPR
jgi:hypothetical protein